MNELLNEWMNEWINYWMNEWINEWMKSCKEYRPELKQQAKLKTGYEAISLQVFNEQTNISLLFQCSN